MDIARLKVSDYVAPRRDPLAHPGKRPPGSYVMDAKNNVYLMYDLDKGPSGVYIETENGRQRVNEFLSANGVDRLENRIPVLAYGTNPCPGQLEYKFRPIRDLIVPVLRGRLTGWDTVYKFIYDAGYAYAQLVPVSGTTIDAWVTLLNQAQFERMNLTEGVIGDAPTYRLGSIAGFRADSIGEWELLFYVGNTKIFSSPSSCQGVTDTPISIAEIPAEGRKYPTLYQEQLLNHAIEVFDLSNYLAQFKDELEVGLGSLGRQLALFLNRHFNSHGDGSYRCSICATVLEYIQALSESMHCQSISVADIPEVSRRLLVDPNMSPMHVGDFWH